MKAAMSSAGEANCAMIGGSLSAARQLDGSVIGMCALPNGKRCSEQSLAAGNCGVTKRGVSPDAYNFSLNGLVR